MDGWKGPTVLRAQPSDLPLPLLHAVGLGPERLSLQGSPGPQPLSLAYSRAALAGLRRTVL